MFRYRVAVGVATSTHTHTHMCKTLSNIVEGIYRNTQVPTLQLDSCGPPPTPCAKPTRLCTRVSVQPCPQFKRNVRDTVGQRRQQDARLRQGTVVIADRVTVAPHDGLDRRVWHLQHHAAPRCPHQRRVVDGCERQCICRPRHVQGECARLDHRRGCVGSATPARCSVSPVGHGAEGERCVAVRRAVAGFNPPWCAKH